MKQRWMLPVFAAGLMLILWVSSATALGLGAYYNLGWGDGTFEYDNDNDSYYKDIDFDADYRTRAIGFVLDTNVAGDAIFNYRLNVAFDNMDIDGGPSLDGFAMDHTFGFGVLRNEFVRLWIGPQVNLSYYQDDLDRHHRYNDDDYDHFSFGFGPAVGVNIHAGDIVSFAITSGYKFNFIAGSAYDNDYTGTEDQFYINFGILFRINDVYQ